ncbi:hypothetical protein P154DRAFT_182532 [Amniculicola lignicola CBS 123094]|uniref:Uncharacterized protein n=1 Tax=Amniculicola lignicola CBS 123094 TaxID=1392246 RepID=A0A6A5WZF9_9PLEO|nr:hypothetical protein P154DRAFT_182532 [Amniculicola lignicola CBS 123094]
MGTGNDTDTIRNERLGLPPCEESFARLRYYLLRIVVGRGTFNALSLRRRIVVVAVVVTAGIAVKLIESFWEGPFLVIVADVQTEPPECHRAYRAAFGCLHTWAEKGGGVVAGKGREVGACDLQSSSCSGR